MKTQIADKVVLGRNEARQVPFNLMANRERSLEVILAQPGAKVEIFGGGRLEKSERFTGLVKVIHQAQETVSRIKFNGVLFDQAQVDLNGLVRIEKRAKKADGFFRANFLLFDEARAMPMPFLEILNNDVKAGHAVTVSKIDEEQLFYLMSRGLQRREAIEMIVGGFLTANT